jgi:GxxExxY protein
MDTDEASLNRISERIIGCAFAVANTLGSGFLEKVYERALAHELRKAGVSLAQQRDISVVYDGVIVGEYTVDMLVEDSVLIEFKAAKALDGSHDAQCLNCLRATGLRLCILFNFGRSWIDIKRAVPGF